MADSRMFITNGIEIEKIGVAIQGFLREKKGLHAEGMKTPQGYLVQAKEEEGWKNSQGWIHLSKFKCFLLEITK